jgi:hypothetical protein
MDQPLDLRPHRVGLAGGVGLVVMEGAQQYGVASVGVPAVGPGGGVVDVAEPCVSG